METRLQSHYESLSRVIRFTRMADTKAGAVLALQFVLVGALATQLLAPLDPATNGNTVSGDDFTVALVGLAYILSALAAVVLAVLVYAPATPKTGQSLIYFEDVAGMDCQQFIAAAKAMDAAEIERQLLEQIYRVSRIARTKMRLVRYAFWLSMVSVLTGITLLALIGPSPMD